VTDSRSPATEHVNSPANFWFYYLLVISVIVRTVLDSLIEGSFAPLPYALMGVFVVLSLLHFMVGERAPRLTQPYLLIQTAIIFLLLLSKPRFDYYALFSVALSFTITRFLPFGIDIAWLAGSCVALTAGLLISFGWGRGLTYIAAYIAGVLVIGLYGRANRKAEIARQRSEKLLAELEEAHKRLKLYAERAEEEAAAQERARLARELHDAVTQTIFSMNLTAEAARMAYDNQPARVPGLLGRLQEMAREALAEMRAMVDQLRPHAAAEAGLVVSLQRHLDLRERRDGLRVALTVEGDEKGPAPLKDALFRTAQEALNNVFRHSGVKEASVRLCFGGERATLNVRDEGRGFDSAGRRGRECFGLLTMRERVETLGGSFSLVSAPGKGTEIQVTVPLDWKAGNEEKGG
jgi:signal transduction histidine kinase